MKNKFYIILVLIIIIINIYLRFYNLSIPGINADEAWVGWTSKLIYENGLLNYITGMGNYTGVLYSFITSLFYRILGVSIETSRFSGNFFMFLLIPAILIIFSKYNKLFILTLLLLVTFNPYLFMFGRWAMPHALMPFFTLLVFYLNYLFITKKKIIYLLLAFFFGGLSIQLLPIQILVLLFIILSNAIINRKFFIQLFFSKIFFIIFILFLISTSSVLIYNSKEVLRIIQMNIGYINDFGVLEIINIFLTRTPIYFIKFFQTLNGFISMIYFSGQLSIPSLLKNFLLLITIGLFFSSIYQLKSKILLKQLNSALVYFLFIIIPLFLEFFNQNMHFPLLGEERYLLVIYPNLIIMIGWTIFDLYNYKLKSAKIISILLFLTIISSWTYLIRNDYYKHFKLTGGRGGSHVFNLSENKIDPKIKAYNKIKESTKNYDDIVIVCQDYWIYWIVKYHKLENIVIEWIPGRRHPREFRANFDSLQQLNEYYKNKKIYYIVWNNLRNEMEQELFRNENLFKNIKRIDNEVILNIYKYYNVNIQ